MKINYVKVLARVHNKAISPTGVR